MDILVTGGNGFVGHHLVAALLARGAHVRVLALPTEDTTWLDEQGVAVFRGDIRNREVLAAPMRGVDSVIHLAALLGAWRPMAEHVRVNVRGTENVCRAALAVGVKRLVHVSSAMVYNLSATEPATEVTRLRPLDEPYCMTKAEADLLVRRLAITDHLPVIVVRPGTVFGPGDKVNFGRLADRLRAGKGIIIGSGHNAVPFIYVSDMVQGLLLALDHHGADGQAFNLSSDQPLTQAELMGAIAEEIGATPPRIHVPYHALYAAAYAAERLTALSGERIRPVVTRHGVKLYGANNRLSIAKARRELGFTPQVSVREGIRRAAAWYTNQSAWAEETAPSALASGRDELQVAKGSQR